MDQLKLDKRKSISSNHVSFPKRSIEMTNFLLIDEFKNKDSIRTIQLDWELFKIASFPPKIIEIIQGYEYDKPLDHLFKNVMSKLVKSKRKWRKLDFYTEEFPHILLKIVNAKKDSLPKLNLFWSDLQRLLFKWIIAMNQKTFYNLKFIMKTSKAIRSLDLIIKNNQELNFLIDFNLESMYNFNSFIFVNLINCELLENPHIFSLFASIVYDFYVNGISCREVENKYFGGYFSKNILLKIMIPLYDPYLELSNCFPKDQPRSMTFSPFVSTDFTLNHEYFEGLRTRGPDELEIFISRYISRSIIEFFLSTNRKFKIRNLDDISILTQRLEESNMIVEEVLEKILES